MPFNIVLALLFLGALGLMALALSGYGSPDRSREAPPRLPGTETQDPRKP